MVNCKIYKNSVQLNTIQQSPQYSHVSQKIPQHKYTDILIHQCYSLCCVHNQKVGHHNNSGGVLTSE